MPLAEEIREIVLTGSFDKATSEAFLTRLNEAPLTRDENPTSHFCAYFAPLNLQTKQVFIGHHKKSGLWLFNGGHIDANENISTTLQREMMEEWGIQFTPDSAPFLITVTTIVSNPAGRPCKTHFDIWYRIPITTEPRFDQDKLATEFYESR